MFLILWEYDVKQGCEEQFEKVYGPDGNWARLFRHHPAYQRTLLLRDPFRGLTYLTCDFWETREAYKTFISRNCDAYQALDGRCAELTLAERKIGTFHKLRPGD
jgi:heme-degrading monooxygenase HmoA